MRAQLSFKPGGRGGRRRRSGYWGVSKPRGNWVLDVTCFKCNGRGHKQDQCPSEEITAEEQLQPKTEAQLPLPRSFPPLAETAQQKQIKQDLQVQKEELKKLQREMMALRQKHSFILEEFTAILEQNRELVATMKSWGVHISSIDELRAARPGGSHVDEGLAGVGSQGGYEEAHQQHTGDSVWSAISYDLP